MGQHPNGRSGAQGFEQAEVWTPPPSPSQAQAGVSDLAKGYVPLRWVVGGMASFGCAAGALMWVSFQLGGVWSEQQNAIKIVQKDVDKLAIGQEQQGAKITEIKTVVDETRKVVKQIADNPPWYVSVKQAAR